MIKRELNERSPLRILEKSTHGGLGKGNIGLICARKGVGKTACLVHIATDRLLRGLQVIHVSFAADTQHIMTWYEDIFSEIARRFSLDSARQVHDEIAPLALKFEQDLLHGISDDEADVLAGVMDKLLARAREIGPPQD